jgi:hypothetical protein
VYWQMKPPNKGPKEGPRRGEAVKTIIGVWRVAFSNMSPTLPPATLRKELPAAPSMKRLMRRVSMLRATAEGIRKTRNTKMETR